MKTIALLTGRGGNTLQDKNVLNINGHPVLYYPATAALNAKCISDWYVSSDDDKILDAANKIGYKKIIRPLELSLASAQHIDVILHALKIMKYQNIEPDILVCLLANNVTVKTQWIEECVKMLEDDDSLTAIVPVYLDMDHHPYRAKKIDNEDILSSFVELGNKKISTNRQDLESCYYLSHNFWAMRVKSSILTNDGNPPWTFMGKKVKAYKINESIDIHEKTDLVIAKNWLDDNWK